MRTLLHTLLITLFSTLTLITLTACNSSNGKDAQNTTPKISIAKKAKANHPYITKLTLTLPETKINKDSSITPTITATYSNNTTQEITDNIEWIISPKDAIATDQTKLTALKDTNATIQAKVTNFLNQTIISNKTNLNIYWEVNGHRLPPEPDPKVNNATLLGVDSNNNGVRDDVERWIYEKYKDKHPIHIDIAMQAARGYKLVLEKQPTSREEANSIHKKASASMSCEAYYQIYSKYFNEPLIVKEDINTGSFRMKIYFNTKTRREVYDQYNVLLSGDSYSTPSVDKNMSSYCDFDTSKYNKE